MISVTIHPIKRSVTLVTGSEMECVITVSTVTVASEYSLTVTIVSESHDLVVKPVIWPEIINCDMANLNISHIFGSAGFIC